MATSKNVTPKSHNENLNSLSHFISENFKSGGGLLNRDSEKEHSRVRSTGDYSFPKFSANHGAHSPSQSALDEL